MVLRQRFSRRYRGFVLGVVVLSGLLLGSAGALAEGEAERDLLYAGLCVGVVWPNGSETQVAGRVSPADVDLRLRGEALMAAAERAAPDLSARLVREAEDGATWRRQHAIRDPGMVAHVESECLLFLDSYLPPLH